MPAILPPQRAWLKAIEKPNSRHNQNPTIRQLGSLRLINSIWIFDLDFS
jgi:hypothetical protein